MLEQRVGTHEHGIALGAIEALPSRRQVVLHVASQVVVPCERARARRALVRRAAELFELLILNHGKHMYTACQRALVRRTGTSHVMFGRASRNFRELKGASQ